jgi:hypothetical protein
MSASSSQPPVTTPRVPNAVLTGQTDAHLCSPGHAEALGVRVHRDAVEPFRRLRQEARTAGFDLRILSGFRSFEEQLSIWNRKAAGQRAVLDSDAVPLDITRLSEQELVFAILRWSALPGASRHHWGTDLDVYDLAARPDGYEIELIPEEVNAGGMFGPLHRGGVAPERWHLSYEPVASAYVRQLTTAVLRATVERAAIALQDVVLRNLDEIYQRFVVNTNRTFA